MDARVFNIGQFDVQPTLKCKGTFVGHQVRRFSISVLFLGIQLQTFVCSIRYKIFLGVAIKYNVKLGVCNLNSMSKPFVLRIFAV